MFLSESKQAAVGSRFHDELLDFLELWVRRASEQAQDDALARRQPSPTRFHPLEPKESVNHSARGAGINSNMYVEASLEQCQGRVLDADVRLDATQHDRVEPFLLHRLGHFLSHHGELCLLDRLDVWELGKAQLWNCVTQTCRMFEDLVESLQTANKEINFRSALGHRCSEMAFYWR